MVKVNSRGAASAVETAEPPSQSTVDARLQAGKVLRATAPRNAQAAWAPPENRADPVALLQAEDARRLPDLLPIRYGRMAASPLGFLRGAAAVMAADLATTPASGITSQLCGDAHLMNFGSYTTPEGALVFGLNDFDETLPGPWEWDLKRLVASFAVAGRTSAFRDADCGQAVAAAVYAYQARMAEYAHMPYLGVWYARVSDHAILPLLPREARGRTALRFGQIRHEQLRQLNRLTTSADGRPRIVDNPPLITHISDERIGDRAHALVERYAASLTDDHRDLLERYTLVDYARKVVGVGSVGTRCYVLLFIGASQDDSLFLQIKEAGASALERYLGRSGYAQSGERVIQGQRLLQPASDMLLGWGRVAKVDFYIRQLADLKGAVNIAAMTPAYLVAYAQVCGWALARAHARSGEAARISGYLGRGDTFPQAMTRFALAYADQTERDHAALVEAIKAGRVHAEASV